MAELLNELYCFENPNKKPLNDLFLNVNYRKSVRKCRDLSPPESPTEVQNIDPDKLYKSETKVIAALDPHWVIKSFPVFNYQPYYPEFSSEENENYLFKNCEFQFMLDELTSLNFQLLWCHLIFVPDISDAVNSFLKQHPKEHELSYIEGEFRELFDDIYYSVLMLYQRILKMKESEIEYIDESEAIKHLKSTELLNSQVILSLSQLYSTTDAELIQKATSLYFTPINKTEYTEELKLIADRTLMAIEMMIGNVCGFEPGSIIVTIPVPPRPLNFDPSWIDTAVSYLYDVFHDLKALLPLVDEFVEVTFEYGIPQRIPQLYDRVYKKLYYLLKYKQKLEYDWSLLEKRIKDKLAFGRSEVVDCFHLIVQYLLKKISEKSEERQEFCERYIKLMTNAFEEEIFISDYNHIYPISEEIDLICREFPEIDETRTNYLKVCLATMNLRSPDVDVYQECLVEEDKESKFSMAYNDPTVSDTCNGIKENGNITETTNVQDDEIILREKILCIQEAIPDLGDGFILQCLQYYDYDVSAVISAIFDSNLPPHLNDLQRDTIIIPPEPEPEQPVLAYCGKKPGHEDALQLLNDKDAIKDIRDLVISTGDEVNYEDEYDEFDDYTIKEKEPDHDPLESLNNPNRVESEGEADEEEDEDSSEDDDNTPTLGFRKLNLYEDPALVRARKEALMARKFGARKKVDVVGKPKGQGQDKNVQINRDKKNTNKSKAANHNRKGGSQWKKSRGMY